MVFTKCRYRDRRCVDGKPCLRDRAASSMMLRVQSGNFSAGASRSARSEILAMKLLRVLPKKFA